MRWSHRHASIPGLLIARSEFLAAYSYLQGVPNFCANVRNNPHAAAFVRPTAPGDCLSLVRYGPQEYRPGGIANEAMKSAFALLVSERGNPAQHLNLGGGIRYSGGRGASTSRGADNRPIQAPALTAQAGARRRRGAGRRLGGMAANWKIFGERAEKARQRLPRPDRLPGPLISSLCDAGQDERPSFFRLTRRLTTPPPRPSRRSRCLPVWDLIHCATGGY